MRPESRVAPIMTTIFCAKRMLLGISTIFLPTFPLVSAYVYIFASIFQLGFNITHKPLMSRGMNYMENINEIAIYLSGMTLFLFTDWIPDIETRYTLGFIYTPGLLTAVTINIGYVFYEMSQPLIAKIKRLLIKKGCLKGPTKQKPDNLE